MSDDPLVLTVLTSSLRTGRFAPVVADWFLRRAREHDGLVVTCVDLDEVITPRLWSDPSQGPKWRRVVGGSDAFVVVTPEYNHSYPGLLKHAIDSLNQEWHRKPVGFVSYGGLSGGLRAVEALRLVFAELYAVSIRDTVSFHGARACFDEEGEPLDRVAAETAALRLLNELTWWARALRTARSHGLPAEPQVAGVPTG
ncbi:NADPH-dependent FMN reductase [Actinosynnema sp. NPDC053489]|uniref:NADPH-dependent FMN reductase n=1 Tax=Actinosynnema sp. NPDC053489 TaxID=3363916 RepID=UPI0037C70AB9